MLKILNMKPQIEIIKYYNGINKPDYVNVKLHTGYLKKAINSGFNINYQYEGGITALILSAKKSYNDYIEILIDYNADVNLQDDLGRTALFFACIKSNIEAVKMLIKAGADVNLQNKLGNSPIMICDNCEIAKILIEAGADINIKNNDNYNALSFALEFKNLELIKLLIANGLTDCKKINFLKI